MRLYMVIHLLAETHLAESFFQPQRLADDSYGRHIWLIDFFMYRMFYLFNFLSLKRGLGVGGKLPLTPLGTSQPGNIESLKMQLFGQSSFGHKRLPVKKNHRPIDRRSNVVGQIIVCQKRPNDRISNIHSQYILLVLEFYEALIIFPESIFLLILIFNKLYICFS